MMKRGYWITLSNTGGTLDRVFAESEEKASEVAADIARNSGLYAGDVLRVTEGESEE